MMSLYHYHPDDTDTPLPVEDLQALDTIVKDAGIYISSNKNLAAFVLEDGCLVGGLYTGTDPFSFDIAVHPAYQGQGAGKALFDVAMDLCDELGCEMQMPAQVHVVNPRVAHWLYQHDFTVNQQRGDELYMQREHPVEPAERAQRFKRLFSNDLRWQQTYLMPVLREHAMGLGDLEVALSALSARQPLADATAQALAELARALPDKNTERGYLLAQLSITQGQTYPIPVAQEGYLLRAMQEVPHMVQAACDQAWAQHCPGQATEHGQQRLGILVNHWMKNGNVPVYGQERKAAWQVINQLGAPESVTQALTSVVLPVHRIQPASPPTQSVKPAPVVTPSPLPRPA